jgi:isopenicillin N synthase-like dioxygenase
VIHNSTKARLSTPFFFDPNMDAVISPLPPHDSNSLEDDVILFREKFVNSIKYSIVTYVDDYDLKAI